ncbi:SCO6745 family protein [Euzebya tangerina]|uniref:SCO6745 family protein n=1 Tax=Euzebya tangerina TaxID=591198 RepID=UPI000E30F559|nr:hypothetical protein [Euzebya tangerina]
MTPAELARAMHGVIEPVHAILYFAAEVQERYAVMGLEPRGQGYIAGRAAPMGPVGPEVAAATFYNFNPLLFQQALPATWSVASPDDLLTARAAGIEAVYERVDAPTDGLEEATELAGRAVAACSFEGRPLAAANAGVELPGTPFADLFQRVTMLREYRGDGHIAALVGEGVGAVEALVLYTGWQDRVSQRFLQKSRFWDDEAWGAAVAALQARALHDGDGLTDAGRALREEIEQRTDQLASRPWAALGEEDSLRLWDLLAPLAAALNEGEAYPRPYPLPSRPG